MLKQLGQFLELGLIKRRRSPERIPHSSLSQGRKPLRGAPTQPWVARVRGLHIPYAWSY